MEKGTLSEMKIFRRYQNPLEGFRWFKYTMLQAQEEFCKLTKNHPGQIALKMDQKR